MKEKWTVGCGAIDGEWQKHFDSKEAAIEYANEWAGEKIFSNFSGDYSGANTENGRMYIQRGKVGTCTRCKAKDTALVNVGWYGYVSPLVCHDCFDDYECSDLNGEEWYNSYRT
jgi:hypothetical protein